MRPLSPGDRVRYVPSTYALTAFRVGFECTIKPLTECISETRRGKYLRDEKGFALVQWDDGDDGPMMVSPASICRVGDERAWQLAQVPKPPNEARACKPQTIGPYKYEPPKFHWYMVLGKRLALCDTCMSGVRFQTRNNGSGRTLQERRAVLENRHPDFQPLNEPALSCDRCGRIGPKRAGE